MSPGQKESGMKTMTAHLAQHSSGAAPVPARGWGLPRVTAHGADVHWPDRTGGGSGASTPGAQGGSRFAQSRLTVWIPILFLLGWLGAAPQGFGQTPMVGSNQVFLVHVTSTNGTLVNDVLLERTNGVVLPLTFSLVGGNTSGAFAIQASPDDPFAGQLTVANSSALASTSRFNLQVAVTNTAGGSTNTVVVKVYTPAHLTPSSFTVAENSTNGTLVGRITTDYGTPNLWFGVNSELTTDSRALAAFTIESDGDIRVIDGKLLDFEFQPTYTLGIAVTNLDNPDPEVNFTFDTITIALGNVNEPPVFADQAFALPADSMETLIGTLRAEDPENDPLDFAIVEMQAGGVVTSNDYFVITNGNELRLVSAVATGVRPPENSLLIVRVTEHRTNGLPALSTNAAIMVVAPKSYSRFGIPLLVPVPGHDGGAAIGLPVQAVAAGPNGAIYTAGVDQNRRSYLAIYPNGFEGEATSVILETNFIPTALAAEAEKIYLAGALSGQAVVYRYGTDGQQQQRALLTSGGNNPLYSVTDMLLDSGTLYLCGGGNSGVLWWLGLDWMQPYWAELSGETLAHKPGSPHFVTPQGTEIPAASSVSWVGWGLATAIAKEPGQPNVYVAGYNTFTRSYNCNCWWLFGWWCDTCYSSGLSAFINKYSSGARAATVRNAWDRGGALNIGTFVKDLAVATGTNGSTFVYALEEFIGLDLPAANNSTLRANGTFSQDVVVRRFTTGLQPTAQNPTLFIHGQGDVKAESLTVATTDEEAIYVTGVLPGSVETYFSAAMSSTSGGLSPSQSKYFVAKLGFDLQLNQAWGSPLLLRDLNYTPIGGQPPPPDGASQLARQTPLSLVVAYPPKSGVILAGNLGPGSILTLSQNGNENSVVAPPNRNAGFLTVIKNDKRFEEPLFLEVESDYGLSRIHVLPHLGKEAAVLGKTYTCEVPPILYIRADGSYIGSLTNPPTQTQIEEEAVTRYVNTGYTVANTDIIGNSSSYTFIFTENTKITFHWVVEHALEIKTDLTGTGAITNSANGEWQKDPLTGLGLTSVAGGQPVPEVKKHWVREDELVVASIDGATVDFVDYGARYIVTGYLATGSARTVTSSPVQTNAFPAVEMRQQIIQFAMKKPATITYLWGIQHRIQVSTSSSKSEHLPGIHVHDASGQDDQTETGEFWFDRGTRLIVGAQDIDNSLRGVLLATGDLANQIPNKNALNTNFMIGADYYIGREIASLSKGTTITWDYGDPIYKQTVAIGNAVQLYGALAGALTPAIADEINTNKPPRSRVIESPPGSTGPDMSEWDEVARRAYPVRPGRFFLDFEKRNTGFDQSGNPLDYVILEISSEFPPAPHYTHLTHPELPAVQLDPDPQDGSAFLKLEYATANGAVADNNFTATEDGKTVLLFSRSDPNAVPFVPATGNRTKETLAVKVVETSQWNAGANGLNTNVPPIPTTIGTKVTSPSDTAQIGTGFIVYTNSRYNAAIYDRKKVADAGPIIPVNRHFLTNELKNDLVIIWYERVDGLLWPHQTERFAAFWPVALDPAGLPATLPDVETMWATNGAGATNYLRRIVMASRLGSEGKDQALRNQLSFTPGRYEQVSIYNQPDPTQPGYNPNEEQALLAPSFKFLDQGNPPPVAYALRHDLNQTNHDATYTSDPFVLVQYLDRGANGGRGEFKMAVYAIEKEDDRPALNPYVYPEVDPDPNDPGDQREFPYTFHYPMKAGEPVQPPYPLGVVIGLAPCRQTCGENISSQRVYWEDYRGQPWAVSAGDFRSFFWYPLLDSFWVPNPALVPGTCMPFTTEGEVMLTAQRSNVVFGAGSQFTINGQTITLTASSATAFVSAVNAASAGSGVTAGLLNSGELRLRATATNRIYLVDGAGSPLAQAGFALTAFFVGQVSNPVFSAGDQFTMNGFTLTLYGTNAQAFASAVNGTVPEVAALVLNSGHLELRSATLSRLDVSDGAGTPLAKAGLPTNAIGCLVLPTRAVQYTATWPDKLPILKVGETLTFAGGEYKADNPGPEQPGLPGVVGWASGEVIYDSLNPRMDDQRAFTYYTARLISPLEERSVTLTEANANSLTELIQPATGVTRVMGTRWQFTKLPASLGKRVFYDPLNRRLGMKGFLNDKTLGDSTLTATPPPVYVLEPNILTPNEYDTLRKLVPLPAWRGAVDTLYAQSRNPANLRRVGGSDFDAAAYYVGLENDVVRDANGDKVRDTNGLTTPIPNTAAPQAGLGPGLALVPGPYALDPDSHFHHGYVTLVENNNPDVGGPISLFIVKVSKEYRYRGAIKTVLSDNVFDEQITLRHSGDFGGNVDDLVYQWFYREEDGTAAAVPPGGVWRIFPDQGENPIRGLGMYQINLEGSGGLLLADNLFFVRYRHKRDVPIDGDNSVNWSGTEWDRYGRFNQDGDGNATTKVGTHWAGAANSPTVDGEYQPQLAQGWIKRVLDRVNLFEARINDFRNTDAPATYASMIQEAGQRFEGPVALNPDKNVIENVGLIELYETILSRGRALSIDLSSPINTAGINNALLLAATRISDLYMLLGNDAYADAQDPTIGYGDENIDFVGDYGNVASSMFCFENQMGSLLEEELALLRGVPESYGRPVYNRLFWNFTKSRGEVAYVLNYQISDVNRDGFIDEFDAMKQYPQGHGDAWGHYLTAIKAQYQLLRHRYFNWVSRAERYNLMDVVIDVDFLDERKFADAAAARAKAGAEIVNLTYRSRYVEDPDGQWQGYSDLDADRAWGVDGWARRAGQGALFDWITANALIPSRDTNLQHDALQQIDRRTVTAIKIISAQLGVIQDQYDNANSGLNPLGLASDAVAFDIDPTFNEVGSGVQGETHFDQIFSRAHDAAVNALTTFNYANEFKNRLRQAASSVDSFRDETIQQDRDYRNRLIEIFGTPYEGMIGTGKAYPAGYAGPDLMLFMYVDVRDVDNTTVPAASTNFTAFWTGFPQQVLKLADGQDGDFASVIKTYFINDRYNTSSGTPVVDPTKLASVTNANLFDTGILELKLPILASGYGFQPPADGSWGRRASVGALQSTISEMVQAQADLMLAVGDYDVLVGLIKDKADLLAAKHGVASQTIRTKTGEKNLMEVLNGIISATRVAAWVFDTIAIFTDKTGDAVQTAIPRNTPTAGFSVSLGDVFGPGATAIKAAGNTAANVFKMLKVASEAAGEIIEDRKQTIELGNEITIDKENFTYEIREQLKEIEQELRNEATKRIEVFKRLEALRQVSDRYRTTLENGIRLLEERHDFNKRVAGVTQKARYQDLAFRTFRTEALEKYRAAFDLASRYAYLAAKAYDYETSLPDGHPGSAKPILTDIVRARVLGQFADGEPVPGGAGLANALAVLKADFNALRGQLSINNQQFEEGRFSLRKELFRIQPANDAGWRQTLKQYRVDDLWKVPEFRRYCRPPAPRSAGALPGLVIPFSSEIVFGRNFFGWPLGPGDHAYDPSVYATKIQSVGVWFQNYDPAKFSATPRVYLVPAGMDVQMTSTGIEPVPRTFNVVDQAIPVPYKTGEAQLSSPTWIPVYDSLSGPLAEIRRLSSFRAYGDTGSPDEAELTFNTRLIARSVWNTRWLLIIPGGTFLANGDDGLDTFIDGARVPGSPTARDLDGVKDILLFFQTYGYSGN